MSDIVTETPAANRDYAQPVFAALDGPFDQASAGFAGSESDGLIQLGVAYHNKRLSALPVANIRSIVNQPPNSTMGKEFYEGVIRPAFEGVARQFEQLMDEGRLRRADPWVVLMHWKGLNDWDLFERRLIGAISGPEDVDIEKVATLAAEAFLKIYAPEAEADKGKRS